MHLPSVLHLQFQHGDQRLEQSDARHLTASRVIRISDARYSLVFVTYKRRNHYLGQGYLYQPGSVGTLRPSRGRHRWYKYNDAVAGGFAKFNSADNFDHEFETGNMFAATYVRTDGAAGKGFFSVDHARTERGRQGVRPGHLIPTEHVGEIL
jgi:hypothetical protein